MSILSHKRGRRLSVETAVPTFANLAARSSVPLGELLDYVYAALADEGASESQVHGAMDQLFHGLRSAKLQASDESWRQMIAHGRRHPLCGLVHQDPFTWRAYHRPRGYAGDAVMMDYIYGREEGWPSPEATPLGQRIFTYTTGAPASCGVRERRFYIAELLDRTGATQPGAEVLAVAAGHLREAGMSAALRRQRFGRFVAMDVDQESLEEVGRSYTAYGVQTVAANVRRMLAGRLDLGMFDLVYSTGLYDYLNAATAARLTGNLFRMLRPGGRLVIANFLPAIRDIGYMEMFMDWHLIYRDRQGMLQAAEDIEQRELDEVRITAEDNQNIITMEIRKR